MKSVIMVAMVALFNGQGAQAECTTFEGGFTGSTDGPVGMSLSSEITVTLNNQGESVFVQITSDDKQIFGAQLHDVYWDGAPETGAPQIIAHDVNNDAILDVFIGTGQGMVNNYYQALISQGNGRWDATISVSNPDFTCGEAGFGSWYRSGPRGTEEYWAIGTGGMPYVQISQTIIATGISHRVVYDPAGAVVSQAIVSDAQNIGQAPALYRAKIGPVQGGALVYEAKDTSAITTTLAAGTPVNLIGSEDTYSLILVEYGAGERGWIVVDDIVYE